MKAWWDLALTWTCLAHLTLFFALSNLVFIQKLDVLSWIFFTSVFIFIYIILKYLALLILELNLTLAGFLSHPGKERELVPRCPCFCLQLFSVSENPFPCRCTNGTHIVSICLFYSLSLFLWLCLLNCGCHPKKKKRIFAFSWFGYTVRTGSLHTK